MICDDEPDVLRAYRFALRSNFEIQTTSSGRECLKLYTELKEKGKRVDILLLDYRLGDMLGDEVACTIKGMNGTKIILISAFEIEPSFVHDLIKRNIIISFIKKPVHIGSLTALMESALNITGTQ